MNDQFEEQIVERYFNQTIRHEKYFRMYTLSIFAVGLFEEWNILTFFMIWVFAYIVMLCVFKSETRFAKSELERLLSRKANTKKVTFEPASMSISYRYNTRSRAKMN